ncbi:ABC transporter substrate-binding protein [Rouxiella sp. Mn2063]|uniref:ABC transporter substrate-binding protein n=1 Tax=Rouxiella sp. Mn2063 TaxID=3395262 RepID=UPI003BE3F3FA
MHRRLFIKTAALTLLSLSPALRAQADTQVIIDIAGRQVTLRYPLTRIFLAEGNLFYTVAALSADSPAEKLVGWRNNFRTADLDSYRLYCHYFPELATLPEFSGVEQMQFNLERLIALHPQVMILNLNSKTTIEVSGLMSKLTAANIPVVFVDMSINLMSNTARSITIMGQLFDSPLRANSLNRFRQHQLSQISNTLAQYTPLKPRVMMERAAGLYDECCLSWGKSNYGQMVDIAGGFNLAEKYITGVYGKLSQETVIASHPDKIVVTGSNWSQYSPNGDWVNLGPGASLEQAKKNLRILMQRPAYRTLQAVQSNKVYAIWHPFYDHPFNFVAIQQLAKWFHPTLFNSLEPDKTFADLFERYLPIPYQPGYWVELDTPANSISDSPTSA